MVMLFLTKSDRLPVYRVHPSKGSRVHIRQGTPVQIYHNQAKEHQYKYITIKDTRVG